MGQEFLIVRCFSCEAFQIDLKKKASRWVCKLCGEKQSLKQVFWTGFSAKEGRGHVQMLNGMRGQVEATKMALLQLGNGNLESEKMFGEATAEPSHEDELDVYSVERCAIESNQKTQNLQLSGGRPSKWAKYLIPTEEAEDV